MITTPLTSGLLRGVSELEQTDRRLRLHRLPSWVRAQFPDGQLLAMESQPAGARLALRTEATALDLVSHPTRVAYRGADRPRSCIDVFVDGTLTQRDVLDHGDLVTVDLQTGSSAYAPGQPHTTSLRGLPEGTKQLEIWLPHNETVDLVELRSDAPVEEATSPGRRWVHHGSSISQGSNASAPSETWPAVAARLGGVDLLNLGLGGQRPRRSLSGPRHPGHCGRPHQRQARHQHRQPRRHAAARVRPRRPRLPRHHPGGTSRHPLLLISPLFCGIHEKTPGPGAFDPSTLGTDQVRFIATGNPDDVAQGRLTLEVIRHELRSLVERRADDRNLHHLDGTTLYGPTDAARLPLPDNLHPDPATHRLIGQRFAHVAFTSGGPFASA